MFRLLLPAYFIFSSLLAQERIEVVQNFTSNPTDSSLFDGWFLPVKQSLKEQGIDIVTTDLEEHSTLLKRDEWGKYVLKIQRLFGKDIKHIAPDKDLRALVFYNMPWFAQQLKLNKLPSDKLIMFMWEPPTVQPQLYKGRVKKLFHKIYTWDDDLVDNKQYFKFYYPVMFPMLEHLPSFEEKKLVTFISANKTSKHPNELYTERENVIKYFETLDSNDFEFYGLGWAPKGYKTYRGEIPNKLDVLKNYRFAFCYENIRDLNGYVTEKIFDCFAAGCVPIYWGASNIDHYIPKTCYIDRRDFCSNEEVYTFIKQMPKETYESYLTHIRQFLQSDQAKLFTMDQFVKTFNEAVSKLPSEREDKGR